MRCGRATVPIYEPGVDRLLQRNRSRLRFTLDLAEVIGRCRIVFVCVDTPATHSGDADLSRVRAVVDALPTTGERFVLVMKSTVPVGTGEKVRDDLDARGLHHVGYVANPEFLREGRAVADFMEPDRIVIGASDPADARAVAALYADLRAPVISTDIASAEMIKYASNAFLGHQDLVHQRDRQRVRGGRRRRGGGRPRDGPRRPHRHALPAPRASATAAAASPRT